MSLSGSFRGRIGGFLCFRSKSFYILVKQACLPESQKGYVSRVGGKKHTSKGGDFVELAIGMDTVRFVWGGRLGDFIC